MQIRHQRWEHVHSTKPVCTAEHVDERSPARNRQRPTILAAADKAATRQPPKYLSARGGLDWKSEGRHHVHRYRCRDHHHDHIGTIGRSIERSSQSGEVIALILHVWRDSSSDVEALKVPLRQNNHQDILSVPRGTVEPGPQSSNSTSRDAARSHA